MKREDTTDIDFVITWVDGSDPEWIDARDHWRSAENETRWSKWTSGNRRFRDWGLLPYWFRGVEKFAPWVNKIHFVTWGHLPPWLDVDHPKLHIVRHEDYIPEQYLPTFNSHTIELNLHRIDGLSNTFVYFNDDTFLTRHVKKTDFFLNGLPRDFAGLMPASLSRVSTQYRPYHAMILSEHFNKREVIRKHPLKWVNPKYGLRSNLETLTMLPYPDFRGIQRHHLPMNFLKSTFDEVWAEEYEELDRSCTDKFRQFYGISPWLILDWQRVTGRFIPITQQSGTVPRPPFYKDRSNATRLRRLILGGTKKTICLNDDAETDEDFLFWKEVEHRAFEKLLPDRSTFETGVVTARSSAETEG